MFAYFFHPLSLQNSLFVCLFVCLSLYVCVCMYLCMYVCMYVCVCICVDMNDCVGLFSFSILSYVLKILWQNTSLPD